MTEVARPGRGDAGLAAFWMCGTIASFTAMALGGRAISAELSTVEIMAWRSLIGLPLVLALLAAGPGLASVRTAQKRRHALRNVIHFSAQNAWFYGVATIPLAQLVALEFTSPIWVALLAPLMLGERLGRAGVAAALIGFLGVLVVARPGLSPLGAGHLAALAAAAGFALTNILTRRISRGPEGDGVLTVLFWMTLSQAAMGFVLALPGGLGFVSAANLPWMLLVGLCGVTAHYSLTRALSLAPAALVAPMDFARLPVVAVAGALVYGEPLELAVLAGGALILLGNLVNIRARERR